MADDVKRPVIDSQEALEAWLKDKPAEWAQVIAVRAALRVFPAVFYVNFAKYRVADDNIDAFNLTSFRLFLLIYVRLIYKINADFYYIGEYADRIIKELISDFDLNPTNSSALGNRGLVKGACDAMQAAAYVCKDLRSRVYEVSASVLGSMNALRGAGGVQSDVVWTAVREDCKYLAKSNSPENLMRQPLWLIDFSEDSRARFAFERISAAATSFFERDLKEKGVWKPVSEWYKAVLGDGSGSHSYFGEEADRELLSQPNGFWTVSGRRTVEDVLRDIGRIRDGKPTVFTAVASSGEGDAVGGLAGDIVRPKIDSPEALEAWLKDKPAEWAQVIAVRAALRVFPLVMHVFEVEGEGFTFEQRKGLILRILRPCLIFFPVFRSFRGEYVLSEKVEKFSVYGALGVTVNSAYGEEGGRSRRSASRAAATAVYSAFKAVSNGQSTSASKCIAATADAARYSAGDAAASSVWQAVSDDFSWLTGHDTGSDLIDQPLWLSDVRGRTSYRANFPPWVREPLDRFAARDDVKNGPWGLIVDWYRAILPEPDNARPRSLFGEKADIAIATQPDEFWTITEGRSAEDILSEIAEIAGYALPNAKRGEGDTFPELIVSFLEEARRPASLDEIRGYFATFETPPADTTIRGRLSDLARSGRIIRTAPGVYVHPKWYEEGAPDWDFFLSYNQNDLAVAKRISDVLEDEGYAVFSQFNDMTAGKSFVGEMNKGLAGMGRMIAAYSPDYFLSGPCQSEWEAAYAADPSGEKGKIVPFMVRPCEPFPLARRLVWTSLLGLSPQEEREAVLRAVRGALAPRDRVAQRAAMKAAASPDVGLDPSGRKLNAMPNAKFDQPFVDEDLFELPERLRSLIGDILDVLKGKNSPPGLATALRGYASELEARGANCSLGILRDRMAFVEAEVDDPNAEDWCSGAGLKAWITTLREHHALLLTHYPLDQERERLLRSVEIDEEKFNPDDSRKLRDEIREAVKEALADESVTESYRDAVENRARVTRDILDLRTPDVPADGDPEYTRREQDRRNRVRDAKKRALAQEAALADKTLDVIGKAAKIADSPAVQRLARSMRDMAEWFWSS